MAIEIWDRENHLVSPLPFEDATPGIDFDDGESIRQREADDERDTLTHVLTDIARTAGGLK